MRMKLARWLVIAMALTLMLSGQLSLALAADTEASVTFVYGQLEWKDPEIEDSKGMNLDFDQRATPTTKVEYNSTNGPHLLWISDARDPEATTAWSVTVKLSEFTLTPGSGETFLGTIVLKDDSEEGGQSELTKRSEVSVTSGNSEATVLEATEELGRGLFETSWEDVDTWLIIEAEEAINIKPGAYKAILTWTLKFGP